MKAIVFYVVLSISLLRIETSIGDETNYVFEAGHPSLQQWLMPEKMLQPADNKLTPERIALGKMLFFDPRLGRNKNISCATCHNPLLGWSDGLAFGQGHMGKNLPRATPALYNTGFNVMQMWDGRKRSLESQALAPMAADSEMNVDFEAMIVFLNSFPDYRVAFKKAYSEKANEGITEEKIAKALASFERTITSNNSHFDDWLKGDTKAISDEQIEGFKVFVDPQKGNCAVCHNPPNFTDNGFHNIGLATSEDNPDLGRYSIRKVAILKGAFKTPSLRSIAKSAPFFHNGAATNLKQVLRHYLQEFKNTKGLSPALKTIHLSALEQQQLVAFLRSLSDQNEMLVLPVLPQ